MQVLQLSVEQLALLLHAPPHGIERGIPHAQPGAVRRTAIPCDGLPAGLRGARTQAAAGPGSGGGLFHRRQRLLQVLLGSRGSATRRAA